MEKVRVLYIGKKPPPVGGVNVSSYQFFKELQLDSKVNCCFFNDFRTKDFKAKQYYMKYINLLKNADIVTFQVGNIFSYRRNHAILFLLAKTFRKKVIIRSYGGNSRVRYLNLSLVKRNIYNCLFYLSDVLLFQTNRDVIFFNSIIKNKSKKVMWFPTNRKINCEVQAKSRKATKFCFVGQIKKTKGIIELYEASMGLPDNIVVDIFGPAQFDISEEQLSIFNDNYKANYKGFIETDNVESIMKEYDVLVLPTYWSGEGYPGCIIEAYKNGLPVITTYWNDIPEIVDETSGILISPQDKTQLHTAILKIYQNRGLFIKLQKGAYKKALLFDINKWRDLFVRLCIELTSRPK